jgi:hypothetical protein
MTGIADVAQVVFVRKRLVEVQYLQTTITEEQRQEFGQLVEDTIRWTESAQFPPTAASVPRRTPAAAAPTSGFVLDGRSWSSPLWCGGQEPNNLVGLTSLRTRIPPMLPKLNRRRALFVLTKSDEMLAGKSGRKRSGTVSLSNWVGICARCGQDSTGG